MGVGEAKRLVWEMIHGKVGDPPSLLPPILSCPESALIECKPFSQMEGLKRNCTVPIGRCQGKLSVLAGKPRNEACKALT